MISKDITGYYLVRGTYQELNTIINNKIKEGWQPLGYTREVVSAHGYTFYQTLVKYDRKPVDLGPL